MRIIDEYTFSHGINVSMISTVIGTKIGLNPQQLKELSLGALLHDIGKIKIPKQILYKVGRLDTDEFELIKNHSTLGYELITQTIRLSDNVARPALEHHERYSGEGYPKKIEGKIYLITRSNCSFSRYLRCIGF